MGKLRISPGIEYIKQKVTAFKKFEDIISPGASPESRRIEKTY